MTKKVKADGQKEMEAEPSSEGGVNPWLEPMLPEEAERLFKLRDEKRYKELAEELEKKGLLLPRSPEKSKVHLTVKSRKGAQTKTRRSRPTNISINIARNVGFDALIFGYMSALFDLMPKDAPVTTDAAYYIEKMGGQGRMEKDVDFLLKWYKFLSNSKRGRPRTETKGGKATKEALKMRKHYAKKTKNGSKKINQ